MTITITITITGVETKTSRHHPLRAAVAIPPGGGIGGAAHNQSVSVPALVHSGCMYTEDWTYI